MPPDAGTRLANAMQQQQLIQAMRLINMYNESPSSLTKKEREMAKAYAAQYGIDTSRGDSIIGGVGNIGKQLGAFGGGLLDALLFGILKDSWYSNENTRTAKNIGKAAGLAASFLVPWGILNATKGTKAAVSMAKSAASGAKGAAKSLSAGKSFQQLFGGGVKVAGAGRKALKGAKAIGAGAKSALATNAALQELYANMSASQALVEIAKALVRGGQMAGLAQEFTAPLAYPNPADIYSNYGMPMLPQ
jgi:hypothetical protein